MQNNTEGKKRIEYIQACQGVGGKFWAAGVKTLNNEMWPNVVEGGKVN